MPEVDGIELIRAIRADAAPRRASRHHRHHEGREKKTAARGLEAGADAYMAKRSFDQQALLDTIGQLVGP